MSSSSARCVLGLDINMEVFGNVLLLLLLPSLIAMGLLLCNAVGRRWELNTKLLVGCLVFVVYLKYTSVLQSLLSLFSCTGPLFGGRRYLVADMRVDCGSSTHSSSVAMAVVLILGLGFSVRPFRLPSAVYLLGI